MLEPDNKRTRTKCPQSHLSRESLEEGSSAAGLLTSVALGVAANPLVSVTTAGRCVLCARIPSSCALYLAAVVDHTFLWDAACLCGGGSPRHPEAVHQSGVIESMCVRLTRGSVIALRRLLSFYCWSTWMCLCRSSRIKTMVDRSTQASLWLFVLDRIRFWVSPCPSS